MIFDLFSCKKKEDINVYFKKEHFNNDYLTNEFVNDFKNNMLKLLQKNDRYFEKPFKFIYNEHPYLIFYGWGHKIGYMIHDYEKHVNEVNKIYDEYYLKLEAFKKYEIYYMNEAKLTNEEKDVLLDFKIKKFEIEHKPNYIRF